MNIPDGKFPTQNFIISLSKNNDPVHAQKPFIDSQRSIFPLIRSRISPNIAFV